MSLAHSVNFYFTDESEPSLVIARVALLAYLGLRQGTARLESPHTTEAEPEICFIDTEACQARNLNSSHTRMGEHSLQDDYAIISGCHPICFRLTYNQCQFYVRWRWGFTDATTVIWQHISPTFPSSSLRRVGKSDGTIYRPRRRRLDAFHINISYSPTVFYSSELTPLC